MKKKKKRQGSGKREKMEFERDGIHDDIERERGKGEIFVFPQLRIDGSFDRSID